MSERAVPGWRGKVDGVFGEALDLSVEQRLLNFVEDETSEPIAIFGPEMRASRTTGDWYGEHAGKWLITASLAAERTQHEALRERVLAVASWLCSQQEASGYLGSYAEAARCRYTDPRCEGERTWDIWCQTLMAQGMVAAHGLDPNQGFLESAIRIVDLARRTFTPERDLLRCGNHDGLSATVLLDAVAYTYAVSGGESLREFGDQLVSLMDEAPKLGLVRRPIQGVDLSRLGTGKIYQLLWTFAAIAKWGLLTRNSSLIQAASAAWQNVNEHHLNPAGGPWGGIARHSEVFNDAGYFDPLGAVETCSSMAWLQLNQAMFRATGEPRYAEAHEKCLLNALIGAMDENGRDWSYFTFANGRRNSTYDWACCKSSGAMALEQAARGMLACSNREVWVLSLVPMRAEIEVPGVGPVTVDIQGDPLSGDRYRIKTTPEVLLKVRIPSWANQPVQLAPGGPVALSPGEFLAVASGTAELDIPREIRVHQACHTVDHHGQEVVRLDFAAASYGPWTLATGLVDGYKRSETLRLPKLFTERCYDVIDPATSAVALNVPGRRPLPFEPYYRAGGRTGGKWRLTWMEVAWQ